MSLFAGIYKNIWFTGLLHNHHGVFYVASDVEEDSSDVEESAEILQMLKNLQPRQGEVTVYLLCNFLRFYTMSCRICYVSWVANVWVPCSTILDYSTAPLFNTRCRRWAKKVKPCRHVKIYVKYAENIVNLVSFDSHIINELDLETTKIKFLLFVTKEG